MNVRQRIGVGAAVALLVGGCATHPAPQPDGPPKPAAQKPASDPAQWEAGAGRSSPAGGSNGVPTPQQVAERAAAYARAVEAGSPTAPHPVPSAVRFDGQPSPAGPAPAGSTPATSALGEPMPAVPGTAPAPMAAPIPADPRSTVLAAATHNNALSDLPQDIPESADFAPSATAAASAARAADPLGVRLARRARENPKDPAAQLDYQLYLQLDDAGGERGAEASEPQLASDAALPSDERDVVASVVDGVANFRSAVRADPNLTPTQQIRPLQDMLDRLRSQADLSIGTVALCRRVDTFGRYDPITPARFPQGRPSPMVVYCEVDNFLPRQTTDGRWETRLMEHVSLFTDAGTPVWEGKPHAKTDVCRDRRRDLSANEIVTLPGTLAAGAYKLKVTVTDRNANKVAESDVPLWIGGA